ncbi:MAG: prolyl oligopeptidase family serine peptidase [Panacagrimonas sp.]
MTPRILPTLLLALLVAFPLVAQELEDPYLWLEEVGGDKPLEWVRERSEVTSREIEASPDFLPIFDRLLDIYDSDARIPMPVKRGPWLYNFWRDAAHPRGLWRRTSEVEYAKPQPHWETVLDLDQLASLENENWVWKGATCLYPKYDLCLLALSRAGADATVVREFDIRSKAFVRGGFTREEAKQNLTWRNESSVLIASDFGPGSMTRSGYPRIVKEWKRGTPIGSAVPVFEARTTDVGVEMLVFNEPGRQREMLVRHPSFFEAEHFLRSGNYLAPLNLPIDAEASLFKDQLIVELRKDWSAAGRKFDAGSLLALPLVSYIEGHRDFLPVFTPTAGLSLTGWSRTRNGLLLNLLDNVRGRVETLDFQNGRWTRHAVPVPEFGEAEAIGLDQDTSDDYLLTIENFVTPTSLLRGALNRADRRLLKREPNFFNVAGLSISQHQALSKDGTRVPYFQVSPAGLKDDGSNPTLLYGYGGFEVPMTPGYRATVGAAWLERGGTFVLANIRGGGEFGPPWHQAAILGNRQNAYNDFEAVSEDLIRRKITSPKHLGIQGGSNGGLLVGVAMTQRPDLFGAVVCQVPLLDMRRYHQLLAGASWMAEYGNPDDPAQWAFISRYSPYQNLRKDVKYPRVLFTTSTRDDRVHPGHARKMTARMLEQGHDVLYYENIEGGHGGAANNRQKAFMDALAYTFLLKQLR